MTGIILPWLTDLLPGALMCALVSIRGLPMVAVGYVFEILLILFRRKFMCDKRHALMRDWGMGVVSSAGIITGTALYPIQSSPEALGVAATLLVLVIHAALYGAFLCGVRKGD